LIRRNGMKALIYVIIGGGLAALGFPVFSFNPFSISPINALILIVVIALWDVTIGYKKEG